MYPGPALKCPCRSRLGAAAGDASPEPSAALAFDDSDTNKNQAGHECATSANHDLIESFVQEMLVLAILFKLLPSSLLDLLNEILLLFPDEALFALGARSTRRLTRQEFSWRAGAEGGSTARAPGSCPCATVGDAFGMARTLSTVRRMMLPTSST